MVLQRNAKVPVWGWADPGEPIAVTAGDAKATGTAGADGKWKVTLVGLKASDQPIDVTVAGKNSLTLHDVLVGDVWVASGQSNMEFNVGSALNAADAIAKADHPTMRLFIVQHKIAFDPQADCVGSWQICSPKTVPPFSAVAYFFGLDVMSDQHVPVGLIGAYWGGTPAESWTSVEALKAVPQLAGSAKRFEDTKTNLAALKIAFEKELMPKWEQETAAWEKDVDAPYQEELKKWNTDAAADRDAGRSLPPRPEPATRAPQKPVAPDANPYLPTVLFDGMLSPIITYGIKGAIWYQGEANVGGSKNYQILFPTMINDWRTRWVEGDFPFLWVQLANFQMRRPEPTQGPEGWAGLREAQAMTLKLPNTGEAVIIDIGQGDNIHPKDKQDVGHRLALAARHVAYGEDIVFSGPTYDSFKIEGDKIRVTFKNVGSGLTIAAAPSTQPGMPPAKPASKLEGFAIAGADHHFVWADALIDGDSVVVSSPDIHDPEAVRYAWADNPEENLYNKEGLSASPFRTDDWGAAR
jgi:sialate O-acetylesterase